MNWDADRKLILIIQRNFLLVFNLLLLFVCLALAVFTKQLFDKAKVEPYLIEYNQLTGSLAVIDSKTKTEYTAQESFLESVGVNYIKNREGLSLDNIETSINYVRVYSLKQIYKKFLDDVSLKMNQIGRDGNIKNNVSVKSITHLGKGRLEIKFTVDLSEGSKIISTKKYKAIMSIDSSQNNEKDQMSFEDRIINPFGTLIQYYQVIEEKIIDSQNNDNALKTNEANKS